MGKIRSPGKVKNEWFAQFVRRWIAAGPAGVAFLITSLRLSAMSLGDAPAAMFAFVLA
jgi:hypothetical protein